MSSIKPTLPKGTRDFSPEVMMRREFIFRTIRNAFARYGYQPLETPAMENLEVLTGKYGEEGDRLIFKILNSGDYLSVFKDEKEKTEVLASGSGRLTQFISEKALRYDLTVPFARFVVMNHGQLNFPFKRYQIQPVWRADRPQKGRYREFYQCDADVVGSDSLIYEAELAALYADAFSNLGMPGVRIVVNHRKALSALAEKSGSAEKVTDLCIAIDKLDKIGEDGVRKELVQRGFSEEVTRGIFSFLQKQGSNEEKIGFLQSFAGESETGKIAVNELKEFFRFLNSVYSGDVKIELDFSLARGLDYYTGMIFEVKAPEGVSMGSLGGGGRYADLTGIFGMPGLSGVGISFGADRIYDVMETMGLFGNVALEGTRVLVIHFAAETLGDSLKLLSDLRNAGIAAEIYPEESKLGKQFKYAERKGIPFAIILGPDEKARGEVVLKDLRNGQQESIPQTSIQQKLS